MEQKTIAKYLKIFSIITAFIGGIFFFWYIPVIISEMADMFKEAVFLKIPAIICILFIACLCYMALGNFWKICTQIGNNNSFCKENAQSMKNIGKLAFVVLIMILAGTIFLLMIGFLNAAWFFICLFTAFVACGIAVICFALSKLIENAAIIKEENDLTI